MGQWVGSGHITKYQINLVLIEIIQFCLNIYDLLDILDIFLDILLKPPQPLMGLFLSIYPLLENFPDLTMFSLILAEKTLVFCLIFLTGKSFQNFC